MRAERARDEAEARRPEVFAVVAHIRALRAENHFREKMGEAFRGGA